MNKSVCIYCKKEILLNEQAEDHVIPESLGSKISIYDVCKKCNNDLGSMIESELYYFPPIRAKLDELGVKTKEKKLTNFVKTGKKIRATINDGDIKARVQLGHQGISYKIIPTKIDSTALAIDKSDFECKRGELEAKGFIVLSKTDFDKIKNDLEVGKKYAVYEEQSADNPFINIRMETNLRNIDRSIAKIGLGYVCYKYGVDVALNPGFDNVRSFILRGDPDHNIQIFANNSVLPLKPNQHGLFLFNQGKKDICFIISFFGNITFRVILGSNIDGIPNIEGSEMVYINPITYEISTIAFSL